MSTGMTSKVVIALSLLLCIIVVPMWLRSYLVTENWSVASDTQEFQVFSHAGGIYVGRIVGWSGRHPLQYRPEGVNGWSSWGDESDHLLRKWPPWCPAFVSGSLRDDGIYPCSLIVVPYWTLELLLLVPPLLDWRRRLRRGRRLRAGRCVECGYNLKGSAGQCSECGTRFAVRGDLRAM